MVTPMTTGETSDPVEQGGCACGAVRFRVEGAPVFVNNCYCTLCQRQSGTGSVVNAFFESERVTLLSGELSRHSVPTGRAGMQEILRCTICGTAVWSHYPRLGRHGAAVRVGTLDNAGAIRPDAAIYVADKLPWTPLPDDIPAFDAGYDYGEVLQPERLARLYALSARAKAAAAS